MLHSISAFLWGAAEVVVVVVVVVVGDVTCLWVWGLGPLKSPTQAVFLVLKIKPGWHFRQTAPPFVQVTKYFGLASLNLNNVPTGFHLHKEFGQLTSCGWTGAEYWTWALTEKNGGVFIWKMFFFTLKVLLGVIERVKDTTRNQLKFWIYFIKILIIHGF